MQKTIHTPVPQVLPNRFAVYHLFMCVRQRYSTGYLVRCLSPTRRREASWRRNHPLRGSRQPRPLPGSFEKEAEARGGGRGCCHVGRRFSLRKAGAAGAAITVLFSVPPGRMQLRGRETRASKRYFPGLPAISNTRPSKAKDGGPVFVFR